ncbi:RluA family pseudouridine synthase [Stackebrandtia nassauensis]|uniref:RNA pseudouridylate synthase n=1 Tax=Stackebrandtia nassauensis (strain DSM 44728 / CIP 108903 / NRRL B-16338 / NBRC 102104 / LLR-40K-21) TaxID=446470 RepID=D3PZL1_STANL|nr:RNA pseudouridine synthase [Stackebrandtia nassauensis]ADD41685.1 pseudouridine synthase [Stackebrandtia nassauensis DSM 44728]
MTGEDWKSIVDKYALVDNDQVLALNKPTGISVMGERHDTDVARLAAEAGDKLHPVHRIDKATSGLVLFARDLKCHGVLTRQFNKRTVDKTYLAVVNSAEVPAAARIDLPLSVGRKNRVRVAAPREAITNTGTDWTVPETDVFTHVKTYPSVTEYDTLWTGDGLSLLAVRPISGRRHQIRVHLAWTGFAITGDSLYDKNPATRMLLHSWRLAVEAPWLGGERTTLEAAPGPDFWEPLPGVDAATVLPGVTPDQRR